jgi:hypothetical protein
MAYGPGNLSRRVARERHELGLTREQVAYRAGMAASGPPAVSPALREPAAMSLSFKPGEVQTNERETGIMQAVQGRATVLTREDNHTLGVGDVLVILSGTCPASSWCHRPVPLLCDKGTGMRPRPPDLLRGRPGQRHQTIGDTGRQGAPGLDWTYGVVVTGDCRRGQTVQPAVMAVSRPISAAPGSFIRVRYLTVSGWWPR